MAKRLVVLGLIGPVLDRGSRADRWERWRPTVSLGQHPDLLVDRFELLHDRRHTSLAKTLRADLAQVSPESEVRLHEVGFRDPWDLEEVFAGLHDFAAAYPFDVDKEDYLVHITTGTHVAQICLFLLTEARYFPARLVQTSPAPGRDTPSGVFQIIDLDLSRYDRLAARFAREAEQGAAFLKSGIATRNAAFNRLIDELEHVALRTRDPILLTGPTGAGKSRLAQRVYELKHRRGLVAGPFVDVSCATLRGDTAMSALFGHAKGAFTGAVAARNGHLKSADGGMLFLDEVGELGADEQAMLLTALEEKRFRPVGSDREETSDFQLIAGTNRDLRGAVRAGRFREDLLARLGLWRFELPSLVKRPEDLEPNIDHELEALGQRRGERTSFSREARERFLGFATSPRATWPANFRDLNGALARLATLAVGGRITVPDVQREVARLEEEWSGLSAGGNGRTGRVEQVLGPERAAQLDRFDRVQLEDVLEVCAAAASLSDAGRVLFAMSRTGKRSINDADRLRKYLGRFGITFAQARACPSVGGA